MEWIKRFLPHKHNRCVYAVTSGQYAGEMLVFVRQIGNIMQFLSLPNNTNRIIPVDNFNFGIANNILEFVEKLPTKIHNTVIKQYIKNESNN